MDRKRVYKNKWYTHFDSKKGFKCVVRLVENPDWIARHGFYPFIHYDIKMIKYKNGKRKEKVRSVCYSAHIDRFIYALYAHKINLAYNERAKISCINNCAIAYRNCLHKNNIHFAKEVFSFIRKSGDCYVIIGDFTDFFNNLDHKYLKRQLTDLLGFSTLPDDYYAVYKNITRFSYIDYSDLLKVTGLTRAEFGKQTRALPLEKFHEVKAALLHTNPNPFGIPQGAAISAVLSNVYMLDFDKKLNDYTTSIQALFRRYSDDFVVVVPKKSISSLVELWGSISNIILDVPRLDLQPDKTQVFEVSGTEVMNISSVLFPDRDAGQNVITYLGFSFDGMEIQIRDKTIHKYYSRLYRKIDTINKYSQKYKRNVFRKNLFETYTHFGNKTSRNCKSMFLNYVERAARIFGEDSIKAKTKNHMKKIRKRLKPFHST